MTENKIRKELRNLLDTVPLANISSKLKLSKTYRYLYNELVIQTSFLDEFNPTTAERLYCFMNKIKERPVCPVCGNLVKFESYSHGYRKYCSVKCASKTDEWKKKHINTNRKKYGSAWVLSKKSNIYNKVKQGIIDKYGVDNVRKVESIKEKAKRTCLQKYGGNSPMSNEEIKKNVIEKAKKTIKAKYGVDNAAQIPKVRKKMSKSHKSKETKQKLKQTLKEKYGDGYSNVSQIPEVAEKIKNTMQEKFGGWKGQENFKNLDKLNDIQFIRNNFVKGDDTDVIAFQNFFGMSKVTAYRYLKKLGLPVKIASHTSRFEQEIVIYLQNLGYTGEIQQNVRGLLDNKQLEADIYLPDLNLVIEADGIHWHSIGRYPFDNTKNYLYEKNRLKTKVDLAHKKGITFLNIRDSEWYDPVKGTIWKSMLRNKLGLSRKIYARQCEIKSITWKEAFDFFESNHLQGGVMGSSIHIALFYNNEIIAAMSFGKSRSKKYKDYVELFRFATKLDTVVVGGASKLLKFAEVNFKIEKILSYANRRLSSGGLYHKLGFKLIGQTKPGYMYVFGNSYKTVSRIAAQKHKLNLLLDNFNPELTEVENLWNNKYRILFDAGNYIFLKINDFTL